jgi:hypothetical protein
MHYSPAQIIFGLEVVENVNAKHVTSSPITGSLEG